MALGGTTNGITIERVSLLLTTAYLLRTNQEWRYSHYQLEEETINNDDRIKNNQSNTKAHESILSRPLAPKSWLRILSCTEKLIAENMDLSNRTTGRTPEDIGTG
jgi:hypothetical protein